MGDIDGVSRQIGVLETKVDMLVDMKHDYDSKIERVECKLGEIHNCLTHADLPQMKDDVNSLKKSRLIMIGAAAGAGGLSGGFIPWIKGLIAHLL